MRRMLICAILCAIVAAFAATSAGAYSSLATSTCKPCGYCHVDTGGGGPLTTAGDYYAANGTLPPANAAKPTNLAASVVSSTQINLTWSDNSTNEDGFRIERSTAGGTFALIATAGVNATSWPGPGLSPSTSYSYRVRAYNAATGNSCYSNTVSATTQAPPPPPPAAPATPTNLAALAVSQTQINLTWTYTPNNETGFKVLRSGTANGTYTTLVVRSIIQFTQTVSGSPV